MIQLKNQLGNLVYVNPDNIEIMELCSLKDKDDVTYTNCNLTDHLAVMIHFTSSKRLVVRECLSDINDKIYESRKNN